MVEFHRQSNCEVFPCRAGRWKPRDMSAGRGHCGEAIYVCDDEFK